MTTSMKPLAMLKSASSEPGSNASPSNLYWTISLLLAHVMLLLLSALFPSESSTTAGLRFDRPLTARTHARRRAAVTGRRCPDIVTIGGCDWWTKALVQRTLRWYLRDERNVYDWPKPQHTGTYISRSVTTLSVTVIQSTVASWITARMYKSVGRAKPAPVSNDDAKTPLRGARCTDVLLFYAPSQSPPSYWLTESILITIQLLLACATTGGEILSAPFSGPWRPHNAPNAERRYDVIEQCHGTEHRHGPLARSKCGVVTHTKIE